MTIKTRVIYNSIQLLFLSGVILSTVHGWSGNTGALVLLSISTIGYGVTMFVEGLHRGYDDNE